MIESFISKLAYCPKDINFFCERCSSLYSFLCEENKKNNLTRILSEEDFWIKHVADSLLLLDFRPELAEKGTVIADLGSGAGFPALILATALPKASFVAIDSVSKKTDFIFRAGELLKLKNLHVITARGRELSAMPEWLEKFDFITARAVAEAKKIFREVRRMIKPGGEILLYKTPEVAKKEILEVRKISPSFKWDTSRIFHLPDKKGSRCFLSGSNLRAVFQRFQ